MKPKNLKPRRYFEEKQTVYEVVDVELAYVYRCENKESRDACVNAAEVMGHRYLVKEVQI